MSIPKPITGSIIGYNYLWKQQHERGETEGRKARPCAVLLCISNQSLCEQVIVLPITHSKPENMLYAVEIPPKTRQRLNLDEEPCWVICNEMNKFSWPGYDLVTAPNKEANSYLYGTLPKKLFEKIRNTAVLAAKGQDRPRLMLVGRDG